MSMRRMSKLHGAIYLHEAIPELTDSMPAFDIEFHKIGTQEGYAQKVYGSPTAPVSWEYFAEGIHQGWNLEHAYQKLWIRYAHLIQDIDFTRSNNAENVLENYQVVISSIPAPVMCRLPTTHDFHSKKIHIHTQPMTEPIGSRNEILYDGTDGDVCYRQAWLFGTHSKETTWGAMDGAAEWVTGVKPLRTTCNCYPRFHRIGRFGKWQRGVLSHTAFKETIQIALKEELITDALH
jgi:hypothetical protein